MCVMRDGRTDRNNICVCVVDKYIHGGKWVLDADGEMTWFPSLDSAAAPSYILLLLLRLLCLLLVLGLF